MPQGPAILRRLDVLISGPYVRAQRLGRGLLGSSNQEIHLFSARYAPSDLAAVPECEIVLHTDGRVTLTGIAPLALPR